MMFINTFSIFLLFFGMYPSFGHLFIYFLLHGPGEAFYTRDPFELAFATTPTIVNKKD